MFKQRKEPLAPPPITATVVPRAVLPNTSFPKKKILLVDDDAVVTKILSFTLKSRGYEVLTATDGSEALALMRDDTPDMLLIDVGLEPDVNLQWDGFQVTDWIRRVNGKIPTIIISGSDDLEFAERAAAAGAQAYFAKPIDTDHLLASIASALAGFPQEITVAYR
jgi:CheY-like chemotaxis protein